MVEVLVLLACRGRHSPLGCAPLLVPRLPLCALRWNEVGEISNICRGVKYGGGGKEGRKKGRVPLKRRDKRRGGSFVMNYERQRYYEVEKRRVVEEKFRKPKRERKGKR